MKIRTIALAAFLWLAPTTSGFCQSTKAPTTYALCRDLINAERLFKLSYEARNTAGAEMTLANAANNIAASAQKKIATLKPQLKSKISPNEIEDLEGIAEYIVSHTTAAAVSTDNYKGPKLMLWLMMTDEKMEEIIPKMMR